jgi:hypothetical protein
MLLLKEIKSFNRQTINCVHYSLAGNATIRILQPCMHKHLPISSDVTQRLQLKQCHQLI